MSSWRAFLWSRCCAGTLGQQRSYAAEPSGSSDELGGRQCASQAYQQLHTLSERAKRHPKTQRGKLFYLQWHLGGLVAPYCAIPRDYLSDTPLLRDMGSQHSQLGVIPPPPFLSVSGPRKACEVEVRYPATKGVSQLCLRDTHPMKTRQNACDTPLCDTISKGYCAIWGVSRIGPLNLGGFLLTVELCCSKSAQAHIRSTFPL